jgi:hypothetical protein
MRADNRPDRLLFASLFLFTIAPAANAYVDAGSGSYLMQVAIAGLVGGSYVAKSYWAHIRMFFATRGARANAPANLEPAPEVRDSVAA